MPGGTEPSITLTSIGNFTVPPDLIFLTILIIYVIIIVCKIKLKKNKSIAVNKYIYGYISYTIMLRSLL